LDALFEIAGAPSVAVILLLALVFDFINGFHDAANSIATIVGTKVLKPFQAVLWAAWWNFAAAWLFGLAIANTVAKWVVKDLVTSEVIAAGLIGAIVWDLITWYKGLPTSSSHALLGGFAGAAIASVGRFTGVLHGPKVAMVLVFTVVSPLIGLVLSAAIARAGRTLGRLIAPGRSFDRPARWVQLVSSAAYSLGHGANDAQKTMGIIAALLYATVWRSQQAAFDAGAVEFPFWIVIVCHAAIALGTLAGGWRIVNTMAFKITGDLKSQGGACAESAAAVSLFAAAHLGAPVSTTHTITGSLVGIGLENKTAGVYWDKVRQIAVAWILTIPASAAIAAAAYAAIVLFS
jgi:PiT family inorganic phosphate transporter